MGSAIAGSRRRSRRASASGCPRRAGPRRPAARSGLPLRRRRQPHRGQPAPGRGANAGAMTTPVPVRNQLQDEPDAVRVGRVLSAPRGSRSTSLREASTSSSSRPSPRWPAVVETRPATVRMPSGSGPRTSTGRAKGAYTGEISVPMLAGPRRRPRAPRPRRASPRSSTRPTPTLNEKVHAVLEAGLARPPLPSAKPPPERSFAVSEETVARQLKIALHGVAAIATPSVAPDRLRARLVDRRRRHARAARRRRAGRRRQSATPSAACSGEPGRTFPSSTAAASTPATPARSPPSPTSTALFVGRAAWTVEGFIATYEAGLAGRTRKAGLGQQGDMT